eukprot:355423-Amorphochlora_amoeboformis.AAC.1
MKTKSNSTVHTPGLGHHLRLPSMPVGQMIPKLTRKFDGMKFGRTLEGSGLGVFEAGWKRAKPTG